MVGTVSRKSGEWCSPISDLPRFTRGFAARKFLAGLARDGIIAAPPPPLARSLIPPATQASEDLETFLESERRKEVVILWLTTECSEYNRIQQSLKVFVKNFY